MMNAEQLFQSLSRAISGYREDTGTFSWNVYDDGGGIKLSATASSKDLDDEDDPDDPWKHFGGDAIMAAAGLAPYSFNDSGIDSFRDEWGEQVEHWVHFDCEQSA